MDRGQDGEFRNGKRGKLSHSIDDACTCTCTHNCMCVALPIVVGACIFDGNVTMTAF